MRVLRGVGGVLLWLVAALVGLVGAVLCVTIVLLPVGIPLLMLSGRMFTSAIQLMVPPKVAHPVRELGKASKRRSRDAVHAVEGKRARRLRLG